MGPILTAKSGSQHSVAQHTSVLPFVSQVSGAVVICLKQDFLREAVKTTMSLFSYETYLFPSPQAQEALTSQYLPPESKAFF